MTGGYDPSQQEDRALCCVADANVAALCDIDALGNELAQRNILLRTLEDSAAADVLLVAPDDGHRSHRPGETHDLPVVTIAPGWIEGRLRVAARLADDPAGSDRFLPELMSGPGAHLTDEAIAAAIGALPTKPVGEFGPAMVRSDSAEAFHALLAGREVIGVGPGGISGFGLDHDVGNETPTPPRRNRRDSTRRLLATDAIFNAPAPDPNALAEVLTRAIHEVVRPPTAQVSIVINNQNYARFLKASVDSALNQTSAACEVIVVDDGSTDGSADLIGAMSGIVPVLKRNGGQGSALNAGFARATGDLVIFLDADDMLAPDAVERVCSIPLGSATRLSFGLATVNGAGDALGLCPETRSAAMHHLRGQLLDRGIFRFMVTSGNAFPRDVLTEIMPIPERNWRICADLYLVLACALLGPTLHVPDVLGSYRLHGANAYFTPLGADPFRHDIKLRQRRQAWRDLADRLSRTGRDPVAAARLKALVRSGDRELDAPSVGRFRRFFDRIRSATTRTTKIDVRHLLAQKDPFALGGPSTWPLLETGTRISLRSIGPFSGILGHGWTAPDTQGVWMHGTAGSLGLLLASPRLNWVVTLDVAPEGDGPLEDVEFWCNGVPIREVTLLDAGPVVLRLPSAILQWNSALQGHVAGLVVSVPAGGAGRLRLSALTVDLMPDAVSVAPVLPEQRSHSLFPGEPAIRCLGAGWDWPCHVGGDTDQGARMAAGNAGVSLSLGHPCGYAITLFGAGSVPSVALSGRLTQIIPAPDGAGFTLHVEHDDIPDDGRIDITLIAQEAEQAPFRLTALRVDRMKEPGERITAPGRIVPAGSLVAADRPGIGGLVRDGERARIAGDRFQLPFSRCASVDAMRLWLRIATLRQLDRPVTATFALDGWQQRVTLGHDCTLPIDLPPGPAGAVMLTGTFDLPEDAEGDAFTLISLQAGGRSLRAPDAFAPNLFTAPATPLGADMLWRLAEDTGDWHAPADDALWLACKAGRLVLPPPGPHHVALEIGVLTLPNPVQSLTLRATQTETSVTSTEPGPGTVILPLPTERTTQSHLHLWIETDMLVASNALGLDGQTFLGGGLRFITYLAEADMVRQHPVPAP